MKASFNVMANLLQQVAHSRDKQAFAKLFEDYAPRIKAYMIRQGADPATAEELAQETLMTVWRKAALYSPSKGSATTWIFTIARNLRIDRLRREVPWQVLPEGHGEKASEDTPPDEMLAESERRERIHEVLATLPADQHQVVVLSFIDGLSHSEISERLDVPLGTVKSRMRLAYQKIRESVEDLR